MATAAVPACAGARALLATMHGKERVVAPLVRRFLGLTVTVPSSFDTDRFGTFSREVPREGSALDAARRKVTGAFAGDPSARFAIASEGSFGPHPHLPFLALDREIVLLADRESGLEIVGRHATAMTNYGHRVVRDAGEGLEFAERFGFPGHGVIVMGARQREPAPELAIVKDVMDASTLAIKIGDVVGYCGSAFIETDMRAHRNPRRMRAIARAAVDVVRRARSRCPDCAVPGYAVIDKPIGLPCRDCGTPTGLVRAEILGCAGCGRRDERQVKTPAADPGHCAHCNP